MGTHDEVIVPVLAPVEVLAGIVGQGLEPVFADLDAETMSLTPRTVVDQVTVHTKGVYVTPVFGVVGDWEALKVVTEPRGIHLQVEGAGAKEKWEKVAPGIRGMAGCLIEVDQQLIYGGADGFAEALASFGISTDRMPEWRGRHRDYPGMAKIEKQVLVVEGWRERMEELRESARMSARQGQLMFEELRRPPKRSGNLKRSLARAV